ncbi:MAG: hypothetical protein PHT54_03540 [Candidatus Nanoarchaeia archaeon]|nr:hypothetical protein [Candidatus Nanoarchaeia archaeon]
MSIEFSDSINKTGLIEMLDQAVGTDNNKFPLTQKTAKINLALDEALSVIFKVSKSGWNFDSNSNEPVISNDIVSGTRTYDFSKDSGGNLTLGIIRVTLASSDGIYSVIDPVDPLTDPEDNVSGFLDGQDTQGTPTKYRKYGTTISLDPIPNYSKTSGLKLYIDREATYFSASSTSQIAGIDGLCHDFLYLKPAYEWARDHNLHNTETLFRDMQLAKQKIVERYGSKEKDRPRRMSPVIHNCK